MPQEPRGRPPGRGCFVRRRRAAAVVVAVAVIPLGLAACGGGSDDEAGLSSGTTGREPPGRDARTVEVTMTDNRFTPARIEVAPGETITLAFSNEGAVTHDAVIGDDAAQAEHEDEMRSADSQASDGGMEGMGHGSQAAGDEAAITVEPGATGELTHTFEAGDDLLIGCHEPGHYDAGMKIDVSLTQA